MEREELEKKLQELHKRYQGYVEDSEKIMDLSEKVKDITDPVQQEQLLNLIEETYNRYLDIKKSSEEGLKAAREFGESMSEFADSLEKLLDISSTFNDTMKDIYENLKIIKINQDIQAAKRDRKKDLDSSNQGCRIEMVEIKPTLIITEYSVDQEGKLTCILGKDRKLKGNAVYLQDATVFRFDMKTRSTKRLFSKEIMLTKDKGSGLTYALTMDELEILPFPNREGYAIKTKHPKEYLDLMSIPRDDHFMVGIRVCEMVGYDPELFQKYCSNYFSQSKTLEGKLKNLSYASKLLF